MNKRKLLTPYRIFAVSLKKFIHDDCLTMSSSVSFAFLLSIIPFATLNMFIFNLIQRIIFPESVLADTIRDFQKYVLPESRICQPLGSDEKNVRLSG